MTSESIASRSRDVQAAAEDEAIVLRSIRYGEADRILHLYTPEHGRLGAIAKGVRRSRSRFGARLEPFFHVRVVLHEGRGELFTVTERRHDRRPRPAARARRDARRRRARVRRGLAAVRDRATRIPRCSGCWPTSWRCSAPTPRTPGRRTGSRSGSSCCWRPGSCPQLASCASCGETEHLRGFSAAAGGVVCSSCEAAAFPLARRATGSSSARSASRWRRPPRPPSGRCARPSGRSPRPPSTTPTCGCGRCCARA